MNDLETLVAAVAAALLFGYLVWTLIMPERF